MHVQAQTHSSSFSIERAISFIKQGKMVVLTDDNDRENEGDLVFAAADCSPEKINFMSKEARGLICLSLEESIVKKLQIPMMVEENKNNTPFETAFTISIEAKKGVTTGISAQDRSHTIRTAVDDLATAKDIVAPGHIFPLKAKKGGVLERTGHTEGSVDLCKLANKKAAAVICEILNEDGSMARKNDLQKFSQKHNIPIISIKDLIKFRLQQEILVEEVAHKNIQTDFGKFNAKWFQSKIDGSYHIAFLKGEPFLQKTVNISVHRQHAFEDVFSSTLYSLEQTPSTRKLICTGLNLLKKYDSAIFIYIQNPNGLSPFTTKSDTKTYGVGAQILKYLNVQKIRLHQNTNKDLSSLEGFGVKIESITTPT